MRSFKSKSDSMSLLLPAVRKRGRNHVRTVPDSSEWKLGGGEPMFKEAEAMFSTYLWLARQAAATRPIYAQERDRPTLAS